MKRVFVLAVAASTLLAAPAALAEPRFITADARAEQILRDDRQVMMVAHLSPIAPITPHALMAQLPAEAAPATVSKPPSLIDQLLTPGGIATIVTVLGGVLGLLLGPSAVRKRRVALGVYLAYQVVNDIDAERGDEALDKPKEGLRALNDYMTAQGWRPLKPGEKDAALLGFQALHGEEKQRVKVQAEAQMLAAKVASSPR